MSPVRHIAFVRNIMVGRRGLTRDVLLDIFTTAGALETRSFIATGNFAFTSSATSVNEVGARVEAAIETVLGHREELFIRSLEELRGLDQAGFFAAGVGLDDRVRAVTFVPDGASWTADLPHSTPRGDIQIIAASGPNIFSLVHPVGGVAGSPNGPVERLLKVRATTRNWNTVERILDAEA
jgi:uncharacterized protein (DUF1697 family)